MFWCCAPEEDGIAQVIEASPTLEAGGRMRLSRKGSKEVDVLATIDEGADEAAEAAFSFVAHLERRDRSESIGLKVDFADERTAYVCSAVGNGSNPITRYNASVLDDKRIRVGDYFMVINGVSHETVQRPQKVSESLRSELVKSQSMEISVRRPHIFECMVERSGQTMGLELSYSNKGATLFIVKIVPGAVATCAPEVQPGDRIVRVGDVEGAPHVLLEAIRKAGELVLLRLSRPSAIP